MLSTFVGSYYRSYIKFSDPSIPIETDFIQMQIAQGYIALKLSSYQA